MMQKNETDIRIFGRISGIKRNAVHDGDGLRTTVFCKGCPLRCIWCHNPESLSFETEVGFFAEKCISCGSCIGTCPEQAITLLNDQPVTDREICRGCLLCTDYCPSAARIGYGELWDVDRLLVKLLADKPFYDNSGGGVTISGGECLSQPEFTIALAKKLAEAGVSVNIDTCGYAKREIIEQIMPWTDTFLYDIKAIDPKVHLRCTGRDNGLILQNLRFLHQNGRRVEIRYPYVPGWNDGECGRIGEFLAQIGFQGKIKVLGYHNFADGKYAALQMTDTLPDVHVYPDDVDQAVDCLRRYGLHAVNGMKED